MKNILLFVFALLFASPLGATTWFVATGGSDSNACTSSGAACATIAGAMGKSITGGDVITVASGTYAGFTITKSGSSGNPITIQGYTVAGSCPQTDVSADPNQPTGNRPNPAVALSSGISITGNYWKIDCFNLGGGGVDTPATSGGYHNIEITNTVGQGVWFDGIATIAATSFAHDYNVHNNYITGGTNAFWVLCNSCMFKDNEAFALNTLAANVDHDYMDLWGTGTTVEHNYFHGNTCNACNSYDCHMDGVQTWDTTGDGTEVSKNNIITRNILFNHHEGIIAQDNAGAGNVSGWTITNNVLGFGPIDDGSGHLCTAGTVHPWCVILEDGNLGTTVIANNTCYNGTTGFRSNSGSGTISDNIYLGSATTIVDFSSATVAGQKNLSATSGSWGLTNNINSTNPNVVSVGSNTGQCVGCNFALQSGSPAINAGVSTAPTVTVDLKGLSRPQPPSANYAIGAYEYAGAAPPSSTASTTGGNSRRGGNTR